MESNKFLTILISNIFLLTGIFVSNSFALPAAPKAAIKAPNPDLQKNDKDTNNFAASASLQALDKITAHTSELKVKVGDTIEFGRLLIKAKKCWRSSPDQAPENKILLEIEEVGADGSKKIIFHGWMFSSSPSISGLEHPIYDITAIECKYN